MATEAEALNEIIDEKRQQHEREFPSSNLRERFARSVEACKKGWCPVKEYYVGDGARGNRAMQLVEQLGPRYAGCELANFDVGGIASADKRMLDARYSLQAFAAHMPDRLKAGGGVALYGKPGTGKDHLMAALMLEAILRYGFSVEWVNGLDLYAEMRAKIRDDESETALIKRFQKPLILCISDPLPPKGDTSEFQASTLYRIIDRRYRDMKSTWATMNVEGGEEANDRIAANIVDRLRDNSLCIHCDWESHRKAVT